MARRVLGLLVTDEPSGDSEKLVSKMIEAADGRIEVALVPEELANGRIALLDEAGTASFIDDVGIGSAVSVTRLGLAAHRAMGLVILETGNQGHDIGEAMRDFRRVGDVIGLISPDRVPTPAWFAQVQRNAAEREAFLEEFGALDSDEVATFAGSQSQNRRATAHRWQDAGLIFSVRHGTGTIFPGFQFDPETSRPKPTIAAVLSALPSLTGWELALWWTTPMDLLGWQRPVDLLDDAPDSVIRAAQAEARDWLEAGVGTT